MEIRPRMTPWYHPGQLAVTGVRVAISTIFGQFADKREALAAANAIEPQPFDGSFDYSQQSGDFWFDFIADTGDGWDTSYAMARVLSQPAIEAGGEALPRGSILIMGGDQVYPTASRDDYGKRLLDPFKQGFLLHADSWPDPKPDLYAVPGNHDWYDGLNSFFGLFCRRRVQGPLSEARPGRVIAGRQTQQSRSYFAIRLPNDWWIWGTDSQLAGYIDQPQIDFFLHVAKYWMADNSKLILSVGEPAWVYVDPKDPRAAFNSFSYLERLVEKADRGHRLRLVLTGDSHHYARYEEDDRHYIVCGGGGAFLHPTSHLADKAFAWKYPKPGAAVAGERCFRLASRYPDAGTSRLLALKNFAFAALNPSFTFFLFVAYGVFNWLLHTSAQVSDETLADVFSSDSLPTAARSYLELVFMSPWPALLMVLAWAGYCAFVVTKRRPIRLLVGTLHWTAQTAGALAATWLAFRAMEGAAVVWPLLLGSAAAALASGTIFGLYLLISLVLFRAHDNEAFSSLRIEGYKSILRMCVTADGKLKVYPIGLKDVPREARRAPPRDEKGNPDPRLNRNAALEPHAIESPIIID